MLRTRYRARNAVPARLLYSSRTVEDIIYRQEIDRLVADDDKFSLFHMITRGVCHWRPIPARIDKIGGAA